MSKKGGFTNGKNHRKRNYKRTWNLRRIIISKIYIPVMCFLRKDVFDKPIDYFINKIKTSLSNYGVSDIFLEKYFNLIKESSFEELYILSEVFLEFVVELKNKLPGQGKLYVKDFKKDTLLKKSVELCNYYNNEFCNSIKNRELNKNKINDMFDLLEVKSKEIEKKVLQSKKYEKKSRKNEKRMQKENNKINKIHFRYYKSLLKYESTKEKALIYMQSLAELEYKPAKKYIEHK